MFPPRFNEEQLAAFISHTLGFHTMSTGVQEYVSANYNELVKHVPCTVENWKRVLQIDACLLQQLQDQPAELCEYAFDLSPDNFTFIKNPTQSMCITIATYYPQFIKHIPANQRTANVLLAHLDSEHASDNYFSMFPPEVIVQVLNQKQHTIHGHTFAP